MLRVLTLNVGSLFEAEWRSRRHEVVALVDQTSPDIVCFQEIWQDSPKTNTANWIADHVSSEYQVAFGGHGFGHRAEQNPAFEFGSAILSRWPIEETKVYGLPVADDPSDPLPAAMPWELVHARTAGLDIFTTHLAPAPGHGRHRRVQVIAIDRIIRETRGDLDQLKFGEQRTAMPPILTGDFNAEPESDEIRFLRGLTVLEDQTTFFQDAWAVAGDGGPGYTQDWRTHPLADSLNVHRKRIDYVFVGDPFLREGHAGRVHAATIVANDPITDVQASDHRGLLVDIEWPSRPPIASDARN